MLHTVEMPQEDIQLPLDINVKHQAHEEGRQGQREGPFHEVQKRHEHRRPQRNQRMHPYPLFLNTLYTAARRRCCRPPFLLFKVARFLDIDV